jgi:hypothetical protein
MATVTLNARTYDSADLADGGHLDPTVGFFAILIAMVAELDAAETILTLSAAGQDDGSVPTVSGGVWVVGQGSNPIFNEVFS